VLGKPVEVRTTMAALQRAAEAAGEWPIRDYLSEALLNALGDRHRSWQEAVRGRIRFVARDDDINYTVLGMLILEQHGIGFSRADVMQMWLANLPLAYTFGPERMLLTRASAVGIAARLHAGRGLAGIGDDPEPVLAELVASWNPGDELCGAQIRADAYGYACAGRPRLAAALAWRDAGWTHRATGVYATMFTAAAIAGAFVIDDPLELCRMALRCVPRHSRFRERIGDCLEQVAAASDWQDGYRRIHDRYGCYGHCQIYQETGTLINTLRFASSVEEGICMQVSQGNDTDSYGATAGSLLGVLHGRPPEGRWLAPFNDEIRTTVAGLYESSLTTVAERMGRLPGLVADQLERR
jgi:ADP-ribosylglycohydrolase